MEIPSKQPQCSWPVHADMLTEKDERIQLWKPDRHRRSDSSIPHPKDAVTKTPHSSSSDRSAPGWATLSIQNPVPWLTAAAPGPGSPWTGAFSRGSTRLLGDNSCSRHQPFLLCSQAQHCPCLAQLCSSLASVLTRDGLHRQAGGIPGQGTRVQLGLKSIPQRNRHKAAAQPCSTCSQPPRWGQQSPGQDVPLPVHDPTLKTAFQA